MKRIALTRCRFVVPQDLRHNFLLWHAHQRAMRRLARSLEWLATGLLITDEISRLEYDGYSSPTVEEQQLSDAPHSTGLSR
jgi:hypothetical protein